MKRIPMILLVVLLLALSTGAAMAAQPPDKVVGANETINNDVVVFDGDLEIEAGATVNGDVTIFNGDVLLAGTINGDLVLFNGDVEAEDKAHVSGDCVLLNGRLDDDSERGLRCTNIEAAALSGFIQEIPRFVPPVPEVPPIPDVPAPPAPPVMEDGMPGRGGQAVGFFAEIFGVVASTLLFGVLGYVAGAAFPTQLARVTRTFRRKPLASGAVGVLTAVAVPSLAVILTILSALLIIVCIGLLGFPLVLLMLAGLFVATLFGWIAAGTWLGERLLRRKGRSLAATAALGTMLLTFGLGLLGMIPFVFGESLLAFAIMSIGLGAVALTQFGRKPYPPHDLDEEVEVTPDEEKVTAVLETLPDSE